MKKTLIFTGMLCSVLAAKAQTVTTFSGSEEPGWSAGGTSIENAKFDYPYAAIYDSKGNVWVSDENNNVIVMLNTSANQYRMRSGGDGGYKDGNGFQLGTGGMGNYGAMAYPKGIVMGANDTLYIVDNGNSAIRRLTPFVSTGSNQTLKTIAGGGTEFGSNGFSGFKDDKGLAARFSLPVGIAISPDKTYLLVTDQGNDVIRKIMISGTDYGKVTTFAGKKGQGGATDGALLQATFSGPEGIVMESNGDIYVTERYGGVRKISNGMVSTILDGDELEEPSSLAIKGIDMYIADRCNIKHYNMVTRQLRIFAGQDNAEETACDWVDASGANARFNEIGSITLSADKNFLLVADRSNNRIRRVTIPAETVGFGESLPAISNISIYPNPATQFVNIQGHLLKGTVVALYDMAGRRVANYHLNTAAANYKLDVSAYEAGLYILQLNINGNVVSKRIAVAK